MSRHASTGGVKSRPSALQTVKSFTRYEPTQSSPISGRSRASTVQTPASIASPKTADGALKSPLKAKPAALGDVFEKPPEDDEEPLSPDTSRSQSLPERFDELPIELMSLTDRFVESLGAKTFNEPPTIDQLSELFQDFYIKAAANISTHISTLLLRLNRDSSPTPSKAQTKIRVLSKKPSEDSINTSQRQMLTASEVSEKRKARRLLEYKRILLEEAVERKACEKVYEKIWRHKSTLDEVRDEKLRSKTAALALVGINLRDLGIELDPESSKTAEDVQEALAPARQDLANMNDEKYPLGKLQHLTNAHKSIVDTLYTIHPSSSSADEILPTLIYALVTSPMEGINIISNLNFIQRFRTASKVDGEAAYCLTNLEAAISFLENVDLASLREDEVPEGPRRPSSKPGTPTIEKAEPFPNLNTSMPTSAAATTATSSINSSAATLQTSPSAVDTGATSLAMPAPRHARTLSNLLQPSQKVFEAANDAVRNTAEEGFKNISNTLDNSFKFLFGKLKERGNEDSNGEVVVPKTLDEARQLVNRPLTPDDEAFVSENSSIADKDDLPPPPKTEDKLLSLLGGRQPGSTRERSVDSLRSNGSARKVAFAATGSASDLPLSQKTAPQTSNNALDQVKNLGTSFNPLNHIGSAFGGGLRTFSKAVSPSPPVSRTSEPLIVPKSVAGETITIEPALQKFVDLKDPAELRIKDVAELLRDYQRLAQVLKGLSS